MLPNDNTARNDNDDQLLETTPETTDEDGSVLESGKPANDTVGFAIDLETDPDDAENDNGEPEEFELESDPRAYDYVSEPGRVEVLLERAGYNATLIPEDQRRTAFEVALCFEKRIFDRDEVAEILNFTRGAVRRAIEVLRIAAKPGTTVA